MRIRSLLLLVLPTLLAFPAHAQDFDIQTDTVRIRMSPTGGMQIDSLQGGSIILPSYGMPATSPYPSPASVPAPVYSSSTVRLPNLSGLRCTGETQEINRSNRSSGGVNQTYSSSTTRVCQ